jgi:two-component system, sensor histidine kinase and response regulator
LLPGSGGHRGGDVPGADEGRTEPQRSRRLVVVADGREAVAAVGSEPFDAVLMDVQMPEMDGLTATACIREREAQRGGQSRLLIVALTAHAMKDDRARCPAAGMDDYLTKPVKREALANALGRLS